MCMSNAGKNCLIFLPCVSMLTVSLCIQKILLMQPQGDSSGLYPVTIYGLNCKCLGISLHCNKFKLFLGDHFFLFVSTDIVSMAGWWQFCSTHGLATSITETSRPTEVRGELRNGQFDKGLRAGTDLHELSKNSCNKNIFINPPTPADKFNNLKYRIILMNSLTHFQRALRFYSYRRQKAPSRIISE